MKKYYLSLLFLTINFIVHAQFTVNQSPYYDQNIIKTDHSIFQISPSTEGRVTLQVANQLENNWTRGLISSNIFWDVTNKLWKNTASSNYRDFSMIRFENGGSIGFFTRTVFSTTPLSYSNPEMNNYRVMTILSNKNVGIGTLNPDAKLTVKGSIHCEEVIVDLQVPADYVFEKYYSGFSYLKPDYTMPTLEEVEAYTKENNHLPNVPSAQEIKENGLYLKEMTNILLQKIEELTLYTIEQEKRIKALEEVLSKKP